MSYTRLPTVSGSRPGNAKYSLGCPLSFKSRVVSSDRVVFPTPSGPSKTISRPAVESLRPYLFKRLPSPLAQSDTSPQPERADSFVQTRTFSSQHPRRRGNVPVDLIQRLADPLALGAVAHILESASPGDSRLANIERNGLDADTASQMIESNWDDTFEGVRAVHTCGERATGARATSTRAAR